MCYDINRKLMKKVLYFEFCQLNICRNCFLSCYKSTYEKGAYVFFLTNKT